MTRQQNIIGIEVNSKFVGVLFTERLEKVLRVFCFYRNGDTTQFEMSAEGNLDNLQHFYSRMNMDPTCSSVVLDEVVQGRVYVSSGERHWLYTLLSAPGQVLPPLKANVCDLPWQCCWRSQEAEILEYGQPGDATHRFAIRTEISEADSTRLVNQSKAFTNPAFIHKKNTQRQLSPKVALVLASLMVLAGLTVGYTFKSNAGKTAAPDAPLTVKAEPGKTGEGLYLLSNHQISGPYDSQTIGNLFAGGLLPAGTLCRPDQSAEWVGLTNKFSLATRK